MNAADPGLAVRAAKAAAAVLIQKYRGSGTRAYVKENGRHQHRVEAERMLGRALLPVEVVHHIDGNKKNNDPSNLKVTTQGAHMRDHGIGIPGVRPWWEPWKKRWEKHRDSKGGANVSRKGV